MRTIRAKECANTAGGITWSNFIEISREPGTCGITTDTEWQLSYLGYTVELNPDEYPAILSRMVYRAEIVCYHNTLTEVDPPDNCPVYTDQLLISFNKSAGIFVEPLRSPPSGKSTRWCLDKDELFTYQEQGSNLMGQRQTWICEGPWYIVEWNTTNTGPGGTGFLITSTFDPDPNTFWWDNAVIMNQTHPAEFNTKVDFPPGWQDSPSIPLPLDDFAHTAAKQKMLKCTIKKPIKDITAITSPTCEIPTNFAGDSIQARPNCDKILEIYTPDEAWITGRRFRISGESLTPYSLHGGEMVEWTKEYTYMCDPIFYSTVY